MPARLRPTAPIASDAILVGDPGRALTLAQALLEQPKMSNHARGLWGYSGRTASGDELTIQATGMGGPSAAIVLADLAELGVRQAIRVGTCVAIDPGLESGQLLVATEALAAGGSAAAFGVAPREPVRPDPELTAGIERALGGAGSVATIASFDHVPAAGEPADAGVLAADMQTVAVFARARELEVAVAAALIVAETPRGEALSDADLEDAAKRAGSAAAAILSG
jgi:purine-nucleoside phosphorylase